MLKVSERGFEKSAVSLGFFVFLHREIFFEHCAIFVIMAYVFKPFFSSEPLIVELARTSGVSVAKYNAV